MAGSWVNYETRRGQVGDSSPKSLYGVVRELIGDAANGSVPELDIPYLSGKLVAVDYEWGSPAPNSITLAIKNRVGFTVGTATAVTANGRWIPTAPIYLMEGCKLAVSGQTTVNAKAKIVLIMEA